MNKVEFIVILVDDPDRARALHSLCGHLQTKTFRMDVYSTGKALVGLQHCGSRPTQIIDLIQNRDGDKFQEWYKAIVKPMKDYIKIKEQTTKAPKVLFESFDGETFNLIIDGQKFLTRGVNIRAGNGSPIEIETTIIPAPLKTVKEERQ